MGKQTQELAKADRKPRAEEQPSTSSLTWILVNVLLLTSGGLLLSTQLLAQQPSFLLIALAATAVVAVRVRFDSAENLRTLNLVTTTTLGVCVALLIPTAAGGVVLLAAAFHPRVGYPRAFVTEVLTAAALLAILGSLLRFPIWVTSSDAWGSVALAGYGAWSLVAVALSLFASQWTLSYRSGLFYTNLFFTSGPKTVPVPSYLNALSILSMATAVAAVAMAAAYVQVTPHSDELVGASVAISVFLLAVALYTAVQSIVGLRWRKMSEDSISRREKWLTRLVQRQDANRQTMVAQLHDEPLQDIIASLTLLDIYQHSGDEELLSQSQQLLMNSVNRIRELMLEGGDTPQILVRLSTALYQLADDLPTDVTVRIGDTNHPEKDVSAVLDRYSVETKRGIYLVVREALINCFKHAQASKATVTVRENDDEMTVEVADDGVGFSPDQPTEDGHLGMVLMQARALIIGAHLTVRSNPGRGTTVTLSIPTKPSGETQPSGPHKPL